MKLKNRIMEYLYKKGDGQDVEQFCNKWTDGYFKDIDEIIEYFHWIDWTDFDFVVDKEKINNINMEAIRRFIYRRKMAESYNSINVASYAWEGDIERKIEQLQDDVEYALSKGRSKEYVEKMCNLKFPAGFFNTRYNCACIYLIKGGAYPDDLYIWEDDTDRYDFEKLEKQAREVLSKYEGLQVRIYANAPAQFLVAALSIATDMFQNIEISYEKENNYKLQYFK